MKIDLYCLEYNDTQGLFHCSRCEADTVAEWELVGTNLSYSKCFEFINKMMNTYDGINAGGTNIPPHHIIVKEFKQLTPA